MPNGTADFLGYNLYAYCNNNPMNRTDLDGHSWEDLKKRWKDNWNKFKETSCQVVEAIKKQVYSRYYNATKWHFEDRAKKNGVHPTHSEVNSANSEWQLLPQSQSIYHDNGVGNPELKYITNDGREAVFDGDTLEPVTDPRYMATYNYYPTHQIPSTGASILDYIKFIRSGSAHFFSDMLPYYLTGNSNTREQFESKICLFN